MENENTTVTNIEVLSTDSERNMNENTCKHKELRNYPDLCEPLQCFEESYEENKDRHGVADAYDVGSLVRSVLYEVRESVPLEDEEKMSFIVDLVEEFIEGEYYDIDPLLWSFRKIFEQHVKDQELIKACTYVLGYASEYTYER